MHTEVLDVAGVNLAHHEHVLTRLAAQGVVLTSWEQELTRGEAFWMEFCPLYNAAREGWPDPDPGPVTPLTAAELPERHQIAAQEHRVGIEQRFLAVCGGRYVGFTGALGTAVHPACVDGGQAGPGASDGRSPSHVSSLMPAADSKYEPAARPASVVSSRTALPAMSGVSAGPRAAVKTATSWPALAA